MQSQQHTKNSSKSARLGDRVHTGRSSTITEDKVQEISQILDNEPVVFEVWREKQTFLDIYHIE